MNGLYVTCLYVCRCVCMDELYVMCSVCEATAYEIHSTVNTC